MNVTRRRRSLSTRKWFLEGPRHRKGDPPAAAFHSDRIEQPHRTPLLLRRCPAVQEPTAGNWGLRRILNVSKPIRAYDVSDSGVALGWREIRVTDCIGRVKWTCSGSWPHDQTQFPTLSRCELCRNGWLVTLSCALAPACIVSKFRQRYWIPRGKVSASEAILPKPEEEYQSWCKFRFHSIRSMVYSKNYCDAFRINRLYIYTHVLNCSKGWRSRISENRMYRYICWNVYNVRSCIYHGLCITHVCEDAYTWVYISYSWFHIIAMQATTCIRSCYQPKYWIHTYTLSMQYYE